MATDVQTRDGARDADRVAVRLEDLVPVRTRVGWGAIFGGAAVALAAYLVLTLLGGAIGLTVSDDVRSGALGAGAAVWAVVATGAALFLGGWVTSQFLVGENKTEAVLHGVIMWGVVLVLILWLVSAGLRAGFNAMWGVAGFASAAARNSTQEDWEAAARRAGVSQETIDEWRQKAKDAPARAREAAEDPSSRQAAAEYATRTTWYTLLGTVLSMAAAVAGALVGAGPTFSLVGVGVATSGRAASTGTTGLNRP